MNLSERVNFYMPRAQSKDQASRGKYNCAESMFRAIVDYYNLDVSEDAKIQMAAFGGGLSQGDACGLLIGGYAALAHIYGGKSAPHSNPQLKEMCTQWYTSFKEKFGNTNCRHLKPGEGGCSALAIEAAGVFEKIAVK
ncbi:MAG: hypothetical protein GX046_09120 [Tissierellia bacterium]|nr:hypothetical protein [Tissierellia bacterium]